MRINDLAVIGLVILGIASQVLLFLFANRREERIEVLLSFIPFIVPSAIIGTVVIISKLGGPAGSSREEREAESKLWHSQVKSIREQTWENLANEYKEKFRQGKRFVIHNYGNIYDAYILDENEVLLEFNGGTRVITILELKKMLAIENTETRRRTITRGFGHEG